MNSETNKILESLLRQQGISEFLPFEKPDRCKIETPLYGYYKNDKFYICDASLKEYELHKVFASNNVTFLVGKNDGRFFLTDNPTCECIVISNDNRILVRNPDCYTYVNRDCFIVNSKVELPKELKGLIFNVKEFYRSVTEESAMWNHFDTFTLPESLASDTTVKLPKIVLGPCPFIKGTINSELRYIFSIGQLHYFYNTDNGEIMVSKEDEQWNDGSNDSFKTDYIWYSNKGGVIISSEDKPDENNEYRIKAVKVSVNRNVSNIRVIDEWGKEKFFHSDGQSVQSSSEFFVLQKGYNGQFIIVLDQDDKVCFSRLFERVEIEFKGNLLRVRYNNDDDFTLMDCCGNELAKPQSKGFYRSYDDSYRVEINIPNHTVFETSDRQNYDESRQTYRSNAQICDRTQPTTYQGVVELNNGKTLVPINFSGVKNSMERDPFSEKEYPSSKQISIVWIDHFYNGKKTYFGLFVNSELVMPIGYDEISFIQYDYFEEGKTSSSRKENTRFIAVKKDNLVGVLDAWGRKILPIEAVEVRCLTENEDSYYVIAVEEEGYIRVIYKNRIISDYEYTRAEGINLADIGIDHYDCEQLVKLYSEDGITFVYKGEIRAKFDFADISVHSCRIKTESSSEEDTLVFLVECDNIKGVFDSYGKELVPLDEHESIVIKRAFIEIDGIIYGDNLELIVDANNAELLKSVRVSEGTIRVYYTVNEEYILFGYNYWYSQIIRVAGDKAEDYSEDIFGWKYNFENNEFEQSSEDDEYDYPDYPDDTDYDRDTYYALGGDDYDAFKERGGSLDDMMDGMGF